MSDPSPYPVSAHSKYKAPERGRLREIVFPKTCPVCGSDLEKIEGEVDFRCINSACPARVREELLHWQALP